MDGSLHEEPAVLPSLGAWIQQRAAQLSQTWRKAGFVDTPHRPPLLLDGVVESLLVEIGRGMDRVDEQPGEAWSRTVGLVRHCPRRGAQGLACELRRLARIVDAEARLVGATDLERMRLRQHFVSAHVQAAAEADSGAQRPGQVRIEMFEPTPHVPMRRRFAA